MGRHLYALVALLLAWAPTSAHALTLSYDVAQLNADFEQAKRNGGGMPRFAKDIEQYMIAMSLSVDGVKLAIDVSESRKRCSLSWNAEYHGTATLDPQSRIEFIVNSLRQPIVSTIDVSGKLDGTGKLRGGAGVRVLGKCVRYASMRFSTDIDVDFKMWLSLIINLNPKYDASTRQITLTPTAVLTGRVRDVDVSIENSRGYVATPIFTFVMFPGLPVSQIFDRLLTDLANNKLKANERFQTWISEQNAAIQQTIAGKGLSSVVLNVAPKSTDEATKLGLLYLAEGALSHPVPWQYLEANNNELMFSALTNDRPTANAILAGAAACTASKALKTSMAMTPIYTPASGGCSAVAVNDTKSGTYYSDSSCTNPNVSLKTYAELCSEHATPGIMGNPARWGATTVGASTGWTYSYASQFNIGYDNLSALTVPMMKRVAYKKMNPVYDRGTTTIFDQEAYQSAKLQCERRSAGGYGGGPSYCSQSVVSQNYYRSVPVGASLFNSYTFRVDVDARARQIGANYLANPGAYSYKYGVVLSGTLSATQLSAILADAEKEISTAAGSSTSYYFTVDEDGSTKQPDPGLYASYVNACKATSGYGGAPTSALVNGKSVPCSPLRAASDAIFLVELEKRLVRGNGTCMLEMRVFKKDPNATNLKPMIMFHGGSWNRRAFGFSGIEAVVAHYTNKGYAVFAPFYRLAGDLDGNKECNGSYAPEMTQDAMDAFNWVKANGHLHGALQGAKPTLFGQSAGAYFVGYIVGKTTAADVAKALMMYPPTDAVSYAEGYKARWNAAKNSGQPLARSMGDDALEAFLDVKLEWYVSDDVSLRAKFLSAANEMSVVNLFKSGSHAPVYMVHGNQDDLVPVQQSISLCNAMGGASSTVAGSYACGVNGSKLLVVDKAAHMLDLCIDNVICPAGDKAAARQALSVAKSWLVQ